MTGATVAGGALADERELRLEGDALADFIDMLAREQRALAEQRIDAVSGLAAEKAARLAALNGFASRRATRMKAAGCAPHAAGLRGWLNAREGAGEAARQWARVTDLARQARAQNDINGRLIAAGLQRTARQLAFLNKAASNQPVYAADGLARAPVLRRSLGEA